MGSWEAPGKSNDWYTPKFIFDGLGCRFDCDVAAPEGGPLYVPCDRWIWRESLNDSWFGFVWMNPPFEGRNGLVPWLDKFFAHGNGIALTPDRTSAPWFQDAWPKADAVVFTPKIKFIRPDGSEGASPSNGSALWAAGTKAASVLRDASPTLGVLAKPVAAMRLANAA